MTEQETRSNTEQLAIPLDFERVTIGILTALKQEYIACREVFDPKHDGEEKQKQATSGELRCWLCAVPSRYGREHVVAISMLPDMGNTAAAIGANILLQHCPGIKHLIMCGIAGAVPHVGKAEDHVRLGDIVVTDGQGIVQYDRGKQRDPRAQVPALNASPNPNNPVLDPFAGFRFRGAPRPPSAPLLNAVRRIHADELLLPSRALRPWDVKVAEFLNCHEDQEKWKRPYHTKDQLIDSPDGIGPRARHPKDGMRRKGYPRVFHGPIGAADIVQSDPQRRDALRDQFGVKAIEMEGWGVADACWIAEIGYLVVRGTCDYCNSTKNDDYQQYAALIAAAYTCTIIEYLHADDQLQPPSGPLPAVIDAATYQGHRRNLRFEEVASAGTNTVAGGLPANTHSIHQATDIASIAPPAEPPPLADVTCLEKLVTQVRAWRDDSCTPEIGVTAQELERQLRLLPRRGALIREGWMLLARIESERLLMNRRAEQAIDVTRLRELRQEAENVVD